MAPPVDLGATVTQQRDGAPSNRRLAASSLGLADTESSSAIADGDDIGPGYRLRHYEIIRELGQGGMGRVFVARDLKLGRTVALKFIGTDSTSATARFLVEARATAACSHENIVVIHEVDEFQGRPYMVLELLDGQTLTSVVSTGGVSPTRAVEIVIPVVTALAHAHSLGIVHRDLKPDNVVLTSRGVVKVLDFGIAKLLAGRSGAADGWSALHRSGAAAGIRSGQAGTLPYMAPEQWGLAAIDHRADIWAVGILFWRLVAGRHPLDPVTDEKLRAMAESPNTPMPSFATASPSLSPSFVQIVDRCLAKSRTERFSSARDLLDALQGLLRGRGRALAQDESPYLGLRAFREADADRFFGRARDVRAFVDKIPDHPLIGLIGPSGVGKSSFVQAGVVPALRESGEKWEALLIRPGRDPLASLASLLDPVSSTGARRLSSISDLPGRLRSEPGYLGEALRWRAHEQRTRVLLFVDQFEELYTLVDDAEQRKAFLACLAGVADDRTSPLRVIIAMRSDFLDRVADDQLFLERLARGLVFLPQADRECLREALLQPLEAVGHRFEDQAIAEEVIDSLLAASGSLPLLQFAAAKLWEARDIDRQLITWGCYAAIGGIAGALAGHADRVLAQMSPQTQRATRAIFQRLVTADRTRAAAHVAELFDLDVDRREVETAIDLLVGARLLVTQSGGDDAEPIVEIVHESLIQGWPTLRRWLDERHEDIAFLEHVRGAARQWETGGRPDWRLWTGDTADEARRFARRYGGELGRVEREFLDAVIERSTRAARRRRRLVMAAFAFLLMMVAAAGVALIRIQSAERSAREQQSVAEAETTRARMAEREVNQQLAVVREKERARQTAESARQTAMTAADQARTEVAEGKERLAQANVQLRVALELARKEAGRATALAEAERSARARLAGLLERERERVRELEQRKMTISTKLK